MREFKKSPRQDQSPGADKKQVPLVKTTKMAALEDTTKLPAIPAGDEPVKKQGFTKDQILEIIKTGRLEIGHVFGFKGDVLAKCANNTSLPAAAFLRVKPFEDKAKVILGKASGKASGCADAIKRLETALGRTVMWTDLLILAHHPKLIALHVVRDHPKTKALLEHIKGTTFRNLTDKLLSPILSKSRENCDMRIMVRLIERIHRGEKQESSKE